MIIWQLFSVFIVLLTLFGTTLPLIVAFIPRLGVGWLHRVTRNRVIIFFFSVVLSTVHYMEVENTAIIVWIAVLMPLSIILRPWFIFDDITDPSKIKAADASLDDTELIMGYSDGNTAVAYPMDDMVIPRHIVNDVVDDKPILVSFCAACNSGIIFDATSPDTGERLLFRVLSVWRRNLVMQDHLTKSIWQQSTGEAIYGKLQGKNLEILGAKQMTWRGWKEKHPDTLIAVEPEKNFFRRHQVKVLKKMLGVTNKLKTIGFTDLGNEIDPHEEVIAIKYGETKKAYPLAKIKAKEVIKDKINGTDFEVTYNDETEEIEVYQIVDSNKVEYPFEKHWWLGWKEFNPETLVY